MRFTFDGKTYVLEFERSYKNVERYKQRQKLNIRSTFPYTTAILSERIGEYLPQHKEVARTTVGCFPGSVYGGGDSYSHNKGRLHALKDLSIVLRKQGYSKAFNEALWNAYENRGNTSEPVVEGQVVENVDVETQSKTSSQIPL